MKATRWRLAWLYALATVLAQGMHDHGREAEAAVAHHEAGCHDSRLHLSGHAAPEAGHHPVDCPACQYRAEHHAWPVAPPSYLRPNAAIAVDLASTSPRSPSFRPNSCRAPPRA